MIKYIGLVFILASAFIFSREYEKKEKTRLLEIDEFLRLFSYMKTRISCFLSKKSEWASGFKSNSPLIAEFLEKARFAELSEAFSSVSDKLSLGEEKLMISRFFESFGEGFKDGEIDSLETLISSFSKEGEIIRKNSLKNVKTAKTLATAIALGIVILLL